MGTKAQAEAGRKRKRNEKEEKQQENEDEADEFVSDEAFVVTENTMLKKDFIGERGFKQLISPFKEVSEPRGWSMLCEHHSAGLATLVREYYANLVGKKDKTCYVRGKWIFFDRESINKMFKLSE